MLIGVARSIRPGALEITETASEPGLTRETRAARRCYPIQRDASGRSARERAFRLFDEGYRPSELSELGVTQTTLFRYFQSWKHQEEERQERLRFWILRKIPGVSQDLAAQTGLAVDEMEEALRARDPRAAVKRLAREKTLAHLDSYERGEGGIADLEAAGGLLRWYSGPDRTVIRARLHRLVGAMK